MLDVATAAAVGPRRRPSPSTVAATDARPPCVDMALGVARGLPPLARPSVSPVQRYARSFSIRCLTTNRWVPICRLSCARTSSRAASRASARIAACRAGLAFTWADARAPDSDSSCTRTFTSRVGAWGPGRADRCPGGPSRVRALRRAARVAAAVGLAVVAPWRRHARPSQRCRWRERRRRETRAGLRSTVGVACRSRSRLHRSPPPVRRRRRFGCSPPHRASWRLGPARMVAAVPVALEGCLARRRPLHSRRGARRSRIVRRRRGGRRGAGAGLRLGRGRCLVPWPVLQPRTGPRARGARSLPSRGAWRRRVLAGRRRVCGTRWSCMMSSWSPVAAGQAQQPLARSRTSNGGSGQPLRLPEFAARSSPSTTRRMVGHRFPSHETTIPI